MKAPIKKDILNLILLTGLCLVLYGFMLGTAGMLDPDEPFYALTAKDMLTHGDLSTPRLFGEPQFEKPIFFYWVEIFFFKLFGISEFSARLGPAVGGWLLVLVTYLWGRVLFRRRLPAFLSAIVLATATEVVAMARIVLTDMYLCLFVALALYFFSVGYRFEKSRRWAWHALFAACALGFLTKGPLGILLPFFGIVPFLLYNREAGLLKKIPWVTGLALFAAIGFPWYWKMAAENDWFLKHFFFHENVRRFFVAEHKNLDKLYFYPGIILGGFFPWTAALIFGLIHAFRRAFRKRTAEDRTLLFLVASFLLPFLFFSAARSKLISYIFPVFPILALMTGLWMYRWYRHYRKTHVLGRAVSWMTVLIWGVLPFGLVIGAIMFDRMDSMGLYQEIFLLGSLVVPLSWAALYLFFKNKIEKSFWFIVAMVIAFASAAFGSVLPMADGAFSTKDEAAMYQALTQGKKRGLILGSKLYVRGAVYYTGNTQAAVVAEDPRNLFYTKHPIPIYSTAEEFEKLPESAYPIFGFLRPKEYKFMQKAMTQTLKMTVLEKNSERVFVRLDRIPRKK